MPRRALPPDRAGSCLRGIAEGACASKLLRQAEPSAHLSTRGIREARARCRTHRRKASELRLLLVALVADVLVLQGRSRRRAPASRPRELDTNLGGAARHTAG